MGVVLGLGLLRFFLNFLGVLVMRKEVEKEEEMRREKMELLGSGDGDGVRVLGRREGLSFSLLLLSRRQAMGFLLCEVTHS